MGMDFRGFERLENKLKDFSFFVGWMEVDVEDCNEKIGYVDEFTEVFRKFDYLNATDIC